MSAMIGKKSERAKNIEKLAASVVPVPSDLNEQVSKSKKKSVSKVNSDNRCKCAKAFQQKGTAYEAFVNGDPVFIVDVTMKDGKKKKVAYSHCSFSRVEDADFCSRHMKQDAENRVLFDGVVSSDGNGNTYRVTSVQDKFFESMGTRGAKKKTNEGTYYDFECVDHPILLALRNPNKQMGLWLARCAMEMLQSGKPVASATTYLISQGAAPAAAAASASLNELMKSEPAPPALSAFKQSEPKKKAIVKVVEVEAEESDAETASAASSAEDEDECSDSGSESGSEDDEEEGGNETVVEEITTDKGVSYALNPNNMQVYDFDSLESEGGPTVVGTLIEMKKKYSKVEYEGGHYSICKEICDDERELILCTLTDKVFDPETKEQVGKLKKKKGEITIEYK